MSFILDALKKSEIERQRQTVPGLMDAGAAQKRTGLPRWAMALGLLLGINLAVLLYVLIQRTPAPHPQPEATTPTIAATTAAPAGQHFSPLDAAPVYAPEIPMAEPASVRAPRRPDPLLSAEDYKSNDEEVLPSISELNLTGAQALPELHLDVHVFATQAAERFVYINMRKYHEGATLQEGPHVERIRRDGVILDFHGLRFILPRQQ